MVAVGIAAVSAVNIVTKLVTTNVVQPTVAALKDVHFDTELSWLLVCFLALLTASQSSYNDHAMTTSDPMQIAAGFLGVLGGWVCDALWNVFMGPLVRSKVESIKENRLRKGIQAANKNREEVLATAYEEDIPSFCKRLCLSSAEYQILADNNMTVRRMHMTLEATGKQYLDNTLLEQKLAPLCSGVILNALQII